MLIRFSEKIRRKGKRKQASNVDDDGNDLNLDSISFSEVTQWKVHLVILFIFFV